MNVVVVTPPPPAEILKIVSSADLLKNLRITSTSESDLAEAFILAAYDWLANPMNGWLNRALVTTSYKAVLPGFVKETTYFNRDTGGPAVRNVATNSIRLKMPPLVSIESVKYLASGVQMTLDPAGYVVSKSGLFGYVSLADGAAWPASVDTNPEAVEIAYTAGFGDGDAVKTLCPGIVQAIKLLAGDAFQNREDTYAEPRLVAVDRRIVNGVTRYAGRYRILNDYA